MTKLILALLLLPVLGRAAYVDSLFQHPTNIQMDAGAEFTSKFALEGIVDQVAIVYHAADPNDSLIPKSVQPYVAPESFCFLCAGLMGSNGSYSVPLGPSLNLAPQTVGQLAKVLKRSSTPAVQKLGGILASEAGGIALGLNWEAYPVVNGTIEPFDRWRFPPRYFVGGQWRFKL